MKNEFNYYMVNFRKFIKFNNHTKQKLIDIDKNINSNYITYFNDIVSDLAKSLKNRIDFVEKHIDSFLPKDRSLIPSNEGELSTGWYFYPNKDSKYGPYIKKDFLNIYFSNDLSTVTLVEPTWLFLKEEPFSNWCNSDSVYDYENMMVRKWIIDKYVYLKQHIVNFHKKYYDDNVINNIEDHPTKSKDLYETIKLLALWNSVGDILFEENIKYIN